MSKVGIYPYGYTRFVPDESNLDMLVQVGDPEVVALFKKYTTQNVNHQSWEFKAQVVKVATRCFNDFGSFIRQQDGNRRLYGMNREFLVDTLTYLKTGKRRLSVEGWAGLLTVNPPVASELQIPEKLPISQFVSGELITANVLAAWCARPAGFWDMLCTMHILFGQPTPVTCE